jgi:hypothetical protein
LGLGFGRCRGTGARFVEGSAGQHGLARFVEAAAPLRRGGSRRQVIGLGLGTGYLGAVQDDGPWRAVSADSCRDTHLPRRRRQGRQNTVGRRHRTCAEGTLVKKHSERALSASSLSKGLAFEARLGARTQPRACAAPLPKPLLIPQPNPLPEPQPNPLPKPQPNPLSKPQPQPASEAPTPTRFLSPNPNPLPEPALARTDRDRRSGRPPCLRQGSGLSPRELRWLQHEFESRFH